MGFARKMKRQQEKNKAAQLSGYRKHGKSKTLFKMLWKEEQKKEKEKKKDAELTAALERAKSKVIK